MQEFYVEGKLTSAFLTLAGVSSWYVDEAMLERDLAQPWE